MEAFNRETKTIDFLNSLKTDIDLVYYAQGHDVQDVDELEELIEDNQGFDVDIIYYSNAIAFLQEHDASLNASIELAVEMGYELKNVNSELLASLLASQKAREEFAELREEIEQFFEDLQEEQDEHEAEQAVNDLLDDC